MLLRRRDWVYLLSLLIPFVVYNLALKALTIEAGFQNADFELSRGLKILSLIYLMRSEIFFNLGYTLLWIGLFAAAKKASLRWIVVVLFHAATILVMAISMSAYQYYQQTGNTFDYGLIALYLPRIKEIVDFGFARSVPFSGWVLLAAALFYATMGPWLLTWFAGRWRGWPERSPSIGTPWRIFSLAALVPLLLALVFGALSLQIGSISTESEQSDDDWQTAMVWRFSRPFMRGAFVNVVVTAAEAIRSEEFADVAAEPPPPASLLPTSGSEQRNVAVISLESTRAQSVTPYNESLETTPFLNELTKSSLLAERAYAVVAWTNKANVATLCGVTPNPVQTAYGAIPEAEPGGIPTQCLADLLKDQGYSTAFFTSEGRTFENYKGLVENLGFESFFTSESMDKEGFEETNYPGSGYTYEDDIMLKPSEEWLEEHKDKPFLARYHTTTPHHEYVCPKRYGVERFSDDEKLNRYLNCLRYQDFFLKNLFDQYKKLGLYEDTVFVLLGDHGEGFGEHGLYSHGNIVYEEGLRIPLIIHDPKRFANGARLEDPVTQLDVLPTITDLLGYQIEGGAYQGSSLLQPLPDRTLMFSCWLERRCLASLKGFKKYIYYYGNQPEEVFDLSKDPLEKQNLANNSSEETEERRNELLAWRSGIEAFYRGPQKTR